MNIGANESQIVVPHLPAALPKLQKVTVVHLVRVITVSHVVVETGSHFLTILASKGQKQIQVSRTGHT